MIEPTDRPPSIPLAWRGSHGRFLFIEGFHNCSRRHAAHGYPAPIEYEWRRDGLIKLA